MDEGVTVPPEGVPPGRVPPVANWVGSEGDSGAIAGTSWVAGKVLEGPVDGLMAEDVGAVFGMPDEVWPVAPEGLVALPEGDVGLAVLFWREGAVGRVAPAGFPAPARPVGPRLMVPPCPPELPAYVEPGAAGSMRVKVNAIARRVERYASMARPFRRCPPASADRPQRRRSMLPRQGPGASKNGDFGNLGPCRPARPDSASAIL